MVIGLRKEQTMRIYSSFKDYYDVVHPYENDGVSYHRKTQELEECPSTIKTLVDSVPSLFGEQRIIVGFCGKFYPGYHVPLLDSPGAKEPFSHVYEYDDIRSFQKKSKTKVDRLFFLWTSREFDRKNWKECLLFLARAEKGDIFRELDCPIFLAKKTHRDKVLVIINPRLNLINFQSVIDPYQAYQEISMFVSSALAKQVDPIIEIPDELKVQSHGFNHWSFRKMGKKSK